ncbi:uncharacterized protein MONOS_5334 [Monocercomonoides exilis]|uniref:uncharacterized protein n=1 Tax=Monocercomonoides exilis TaxID=2049356 RepID=UPI003559D8F2|nr:hypothetical protein MONOS_5334 [Monocercomonoides exilis]|eukprot:MONOS_5334.1-p1 / transcript=MONOS_5334.1 / gene=MONOS_5334 / organism=Monocercomonoides_exilis_PA203 / gene_product=unspecified product / transcript_product=unspecified product / location=Mono_scaffold00154:11934-12926(-) / protein_length=284 / sequence_SO=supercontig / SO=protein_coding / is_pseudo=false
MSNLIPTMSTMKGTRKNKRNLVQLRESRSGSAGGRRVTEAEEMKGVNVYLPPLLNPSSGSSSGSGSVSVPLYPQQRLVQRGAMNKKGYVFRLPHLGMQEPNEGGRGHEGRMSSKKEKFGGLDGLQDLDGDDLDGGMRRMLGEGEEDREWDDGFREPDQKKFLRVSFKSSSAIQFSDCTGLLPFSVTSNNTHTSQLSQLPFLTCLKEGHAEQLSLFRAVTEELLEEMMKELTGTYPFLQQAHECLSFKKPCQFAALSSSHALRLKPMKVSEFAFAKLAALAALP